MRTRTRKNRKRKVRNSSPKKARSAFSAFGHKLKMTAASLLGLAGGVWICVSIYQAEPGQASGPSIPLSVSQTSTTPVDEVLVKVPDRERGPERVVDVTKVHPALGKVKEGQFVQTLPGNYDVHFTLNPAVQARAEDILQKNQVPFGAVVAIDPRDGKLLAMADYQHGQGLHTGFALTAAQPAASLFKVVSAAALMEHAGIKPGKTVCYHGGRSGITKNELTPNKKKDTLCRTLSDSMAHSSNVVFARLADKHLSPEALAKWGTRFGFNTEIPFLWNVENSRLELPRERVAYAGSAAGFGHSHMSPLHAALLAATVGNKGFTPRPRLVDSINRDGHQLYAAKSETLRSAIAPSTAQTLTKMMTKTTTKGTAAKYFRKKAKSLDGISVAGKTGSLSSVTGGKRRHNSWFIAFAPAENPRIAVAALVVNDPAWRIKGTYLGREILESFFENEAKNTAKANQ